MHRPSRSVDQLVTHYVERRSGQARPISLAQAVTAIRTVMPDCPVSDRRLADELARAAVASGHGVAFDLDTLPAGSRR